MTDAERLALLLEGKLSAEDRTKLLADLEASPELREAYADAIAVLDVAVPAPARDRGPTPISSAPSLRRRVTGFAIAAGLLLALLVPLTRSARRPTNLPQSSAIVALLADRGRDASQLEAKPWRELRGASQTLPRRASAVRIGALIADFDIASARGDSSASVIAARIAALADAYPGGGGAGDAYRAVAADRTATAAKKDEALGAMETLAGANELRLGTWLEAARIAVRSRDSSFFAAPATSRALNVARSIGADQTTVRDAAAALSAALDARPRDWTAISGAVDKLLKALAD